MRINRSAVQSIIVSAGLLLSATSSAADGKTVSTQAKAAAKEAKEDIKEAMLNSKIRLALLKTLKGADSVRVGVTVKGSTAMLSGEVEDRASEKMASEAAKSVAGITAVKSSIKLNPKAPHQDNLEASIKDAVLVSEVRLRLLQEVGESAVGIHITASDGAVSLRGEMPNNTLREKAVLQVKTMPSVTRVEDLMTTTP